MINSIVHQKYQEKFCYKGTPFREFNSVVNNLVLSDKAFDKKRIFERLKKLNDLYDYKLGKGKMVTLVDKAVDYIAKKRKSIRTKMLCQKWSCFTRENCSKDPAKDDPELLRKLKMNRVQGEKAFERFVLRSLHRSSKIYCFSFNRLFVQRQQQEPCRDGSSPSA